MKQCYFLIRCLGLVLFFLFIATGANAQDVIVKNDKSEIQAKVLEITDVNIKYKQFDFQDGPVYSTNKADVFMIIYQNGKRETFGPEAVQKPLVAEKPMAAPTAEPVIAQVSKKDRPFVKNPTRIMLGFGGYKQDGYAEKAPKAAFEAVKSRSIFSGVGFASNNFVDMFWIRYNNMVEAPGGGMTQDGSGSSSIETIYGSKHYLSGYVFKEFDTRFISAGLLAGPGVNFTQGRYSLQTWNASNNTWTYSVNDAEASFFTFGLHTGVYLHKYLSTNKKGEKNFFMRLSFEQFVMAKGSFGSVLGLSFGL